MPYRVKNLTRTCIFFQKVFELTKNCFFKKKLFLCVERPNWQSCRGRRYLGQKPNKGRGGGEYADFCLREKVFFRYCCLRIMIAESSPGRGRQKIVERKGLRETHGGFPLSPRKKRNKSRKSFWAGFYLLWRFGKVAIFDLAWSRYYCLLSNLIFAHLKKLIFLLDL